MTRNAPTAVRLLRTAVVALLVLLALPAGAAGTGGIEISPYPGVVDGRQVTAFHAAVPSRGSTTLRYSLRNTTAAPAKARLFGASASRSASGSYTIGDPGSSPYLEFDEREVTLKAGEVRLGSFRVHPGPDGRPAQTTYAAIVVEVIHGSVVQRAATIVHLKRGRLVPLPLLLVIVAVGVLALVAAAFLVVGRRRRRA